MQTIGTKEITIRTFKRNDIKQLKQLMYDLAVFEGYADQFMVTEEHLEEYGLSNQPLFHCYVAHSPHSNQLLGMTVIHVINWTFDLKPTLVLKELYVKDTARGKNVGKLLIKAVANHAKKIGAPRVKWLVLKNNKNAKNFYQSLGASEDEVWENWAMEESTINRLIK